MEYFEESVDVAAESDEQGKEQSLTLQKSFVTAAAAGITTASQIGDSKSITSDLETGSQVGALVAQRTVVQNNTYHRKSVRRGDGRRNGGTSDESHESGAADSNDRRFVRMRRRCRSVLERALLSAEYRRARVRRYVRYEDLVVRLRVACSSLDERGRNDVTSMFDVVRRSYFRSLYEASLHSFVLLADTASSVHEALARALSLFPWRGSAVSARTHNWLLLRLSEEYARVQFFRVYEYVRLYELDREMRNHETYDFAETESVSSKHNGDNAENVLHAKLASMMQDSLSLLNTNSTATAAAAAAPRDDERQQLCGDSSRNNTFVRLITRVRDILLCIRIVETIITAAVWLRDRDSNSLRPNSPDSPQQQPTLLHFVEDSVAKFLGKTVSSSSLANIARDLILLRGEREGGGEPRRNTTNTNVFGIATPAWNLTLNDAGGGDGSDAIVTAVAAVNGGDAATNRILRETLLSNAIQPDEYFALYNVLAACDRNFLRSDTPFYANLFAAMLVQL